MKRAEKYFYIFISISIPLGLIYLISLSGGEWTQRENLILTIVLAVFSGLTSWIISSFYSEDQVDNAKKEYEKNLKTYALKASEKVDNLSNELDRLSIYLQEELDSDENNPMEMELFAKEERIQSAIHIINTLKSINDKSLSDWQGIIPDELEEKREEKEKKMRDLSDVISDLERLKTSAVSLDDKNLEDRISELSKKIDLIAPITGLAIPKKKSSREKIDVPCPNCGETLTYSQKKNPKSVKKLKCENCGSAVISRWNEEEGFFQEVKNKTSVISEELIERIKRELPNQPWPQGTSKAVAETIGVSDGMVRKVINILVERGVFKLQKDGILYEKEDEAIEEINKQLNE